VRVTTAAGTAASSFLYIPPALVDLPPGYITTVAGVGRFFGDYGPAVQAGVAPWGLAFGPDGSLYAGEPGHERVVRIAPDGALAPFAGTVLTARNSGDGGPATSAQIGFPRGVAVDRNGDVYITDEGYDAIRRVDGRTGVIRSVAGNKGRSYSGDGGPAIDAALNDPSHIVSDGNGTIWFTDWGNHRIRRITPDGKIDTICGTGKPGFSGDGGPARLAQFNLDNPDQGDLAYDPAGFLYLADTSNNRIRRIDLASGTIDTFLAAGPGSGLAMRDLRSVGVHPSGDVYFYADGQIMRAGRDGQVREKLGAAGGPRAAIGKPIAEAGFGLVIGITFDSLGNPVVTDATVLRILRLNRATGLVENVAGIDPQAYGEPQGPLAAAMQIEDVAALPSGEVIFSGATRVRKLGSDGKMSVIAGTGTFSGPQENVPAAQAPWGGPGLDADAAGSIFMATTSGVMRIDPQGIVHKFAGLNDGGCGYSGDGGPALAAGLCQPWDIAVDRDGNVFIADTNNNRIRRVDGRTGIITTVAGSGPVNGYERYYGRGSYCGDGGPALQACLNTPFGVAVNADGELFIADQGNGRIRKVDRAGIISTLTMARPFTLIVDAAGNLWGSTGTALLRITPSGAVQQIAGGTEPGFSGDGGPASQALVNPPCCGGVAGTAIDHEGNVFFTDGQNRRLRAIRFAAVLAPQGARAAARGGTPQSTPIGVAFADLLSVTVTDNAGVPAGNVRVDFAAPDSGASCRFSNHLSRISAVTDRNGIASTACTANTTTGAFTVTAVPLTANASVSFALTNTAPRLAGNSIVNGASFAGGAVAPGEIVTIFGAGVGPEQLIVASPVNGRFGTQLGGVRARFNGVEAPVLFARFDQVGAIAPYALDGASSAQVAVEFAGVASNTITLPVASAAPAIFSSNSSGRGQGAILNEDGSVNSAANPAARGSIVVLFATGEGQTDPPGSDGILANAVYPKPKLSVSVTIGGQPAEVLYAGAAPTLVAGALQVNVRVPAAIAGAPDVPVSVRVGNTEGPAGITVAIRQAP
jgi:uncharacterized protein (TIGR03437 family)